MADSRRELFKIDAVPAKDILRNKARVCPPIPALCEILDNIFDNYEENGASGPLSITIAATGSDSDAEISITENSGGVARAKLEPLVRLGVPYHASKGSIGIWGEGFKVAAFSLGDDVEILTNFPTEKPVAVHFAEGWLSDKDWSVPVYSIPSSTVPVGSTIFRIRHLHRRIDWAEIMRETAIIYGHKIRDIEDAGNRVKIAFQIGGAETVIKGRALAAPEMLRQRLAYPPDFSPRSVTAEWDTDHGSVSCLLIVGLTPRHSGETSGVYMYGNGRLFARAMRTKAVGYGESGNAVLRDHPSCWRIHAYAFFTADHGADIPWQAPLKDGVSENHPITARFRELFKTVVAPYSSFAKVAKAADLMPYTDEWARMEAEEKAATLFATKSKESLDRLKALPRAITEFEPPSAIPTLHSDSKDFDKKLSDLHEQAKYARNVIKKRNDMGSRFEEVALRSLNPRAFTGVSSTGPAFKHPKELFTKTDVVPRFIKVTIEVLDNRLAKLKALLECSDDKEAIANAVAFTIRHYEEVKVKAPSKTIRKTARGR